jgi:hypothetical protein
MKQTSKQQTPQHRFAELSEVDLKAIQGGCGGFGRMRFMMPPIGAMTPGDMTTGGMTPGSTPTSSTPTSGMTTGGMTQDPTTSTDSSQG